MLRTTILFYKSNKIQLVQKNISSLDNYSNQNKFYKPILSERCGLKSASKFHKSKQGLSTVIRLRLLCCHRSTRESSITSTDPQIVPPIVLKINDASSRRLLHNNSGPNNYFSTDPHFSISLRYRL